MDTKNSEKHIHIHINNLIGQVSICSKEDACNFEKKLTETFYRVVDNASTIDDQPDQGQSQENQ